MSRPTRDMPARRAYLELRAVARRQRRPTDELLVLYVLERFLYRADHARQPLRVDGNVGGPVTPAPIEVDFPALLDKPFRVVAYPIETVLAENS